MRAGVLSNLHEIFYFQKWNRYTLHTYALSLCIEKKGVYFGFFEGYFPGLDIIML